MPALHSVRAAASSRVVAETRPLSLRACAVPLLSASRSGGGRSTGLGAGAGTAPFGRAAPRPLSGTVTARRAPPEGRFWRRGAACLAIVFVQYSPTVYESSKAGIK